MPLTLVHHELDDIQFSDSTRLDGTTLHVHERELRDLLRPDEILEDVAFEIVRPGEKCRVGPIFDIIEPRAKEPGAGVDFPGTLGMPDTAGIGTTHVLAGAAVTVLCEEAGGVATRAGVGTVLAMSGAPAEFSSYSALQHLIVIPRVRKGRVQHSVHRAIRLAGLKTAVYLAQAGARASDGQVATFDPVGPAVTGREDLPRVAYVGQIFSRQRRPEVDEGILYGANTDGMLPALLHPDEWLDGAVLPSYFSSMSGVQTYFYQNQPIILDLYRRHHARELNFVGTVATIAATDNADRDRNCRTSANLVKWVLGADAAVLTKYGGGAPHADLAETGRLLEGMGVRTAVMATDVAQDRRVESALLFNTPAVDAIVYCGGMDTRWQLEPVDRIVAGSSRMAEALAGIKELKAQNVVGVTNLQGASRLGVALY